MVYSVQKRFRKRQCVVCTAEEYALKVATVDLVFSRVHYLLLFDHEDGGGTFLRNIDRIVVNCTKSRRIVYRHTELDGTLCRLVTELLTGRYTWRCQCHSFAQA
jgi:hypothetical protein